MIEPGTVLAGAASVSFIGIGANAAQLAQVTLQLGRYVWKKLAFTDETVNERIFYTVSFIYSRIARRSVLLSVLSLFLVYFTYQNTNLYDHNMLIDLMLGGGTLVPSLPYLMKKKLGKKFNFNFLFVNKKELELLLAYENFVTKYTNKLMNEDFTQKFIVKYSKKEIDFLTEKPKSFNKLNFGNFFSHSDLTDDFYKLIRNYDDNIDPDDRINICNELLRLKSPEPQFIAFNNLGAIAAEKGDLKLANQYFDKALSISKEHELIYQNVTKNNKKMITQITNL